MDAIYYYIFRKYKSLFFILLLLLFHCDISFAGVLYRNTLKTKSNLLFSSLISTKIDFNDDAKDNKINFKNNIKEEEVKEEEVKEEVKEEEVKEEEVKEEVKEEDINICENYQVKIKDLDFEMCTLYGILIKLSYNIDTEYKELFYVQCKKIYDMLVTLQSLLPLNYVNNSYKELIFILKRLLDAIAHDQNNIFLADLICKKDIFFKCCEVTT